MKKNLFLLGICLLLAGSVCAQGYYYGPRRVRRQPQRNQYGDFYKVRVGITGGLNIANTVDASYNQGYSTGAITGFNAGLFLDIPLIYPLSFTPEVLYSQKGYAAVTADGNFTQHSDYIDVPLLAKFHLSPTFNFLIGPQVSFPVSTTNTYDNGFVITNEHFYNTYGNGTILDGVIGVSFDLGRDVELRGRYTVDLERNQQNASYGGDYPNRFGKLA